MGGPSARPRRWAIIESAANAPGWARRGLPLDFHVGVMCQREPELTKRRPYHDPRRMEEYVVTTEDLLEEWRDATRAAELAERLAKLAAESALRADQSASGAEEIARMAERAAKAAERASNSARKAADRAAKFARENRGETLAEADQSVVDTKAAELKARGRYHDAEREAHERHG